MPILIKKILIFINLACWVWPLTVLAAVDPRTGLSNATPSTISRFGDLPTIIGLIVKGVLGLLGVIFLILILYAGFQWMTAAGDSGKVTKAKDLIRNAVIGLIITLAAYVIALFILNSLGIK